MSTHHHQSSSPKTLGDLVNRRRWTLVRRFQAVRNSEFQLLVQY
jgi:hypothetical protein